MSGKMHVKFPVTGLQAATGSFTRPGLDSNPAFTDATATRLVVSEDINVMLMTNDTYRTFPPGPVCAARQAVATDGSACNGLPDHGSRFGHGSRDPGDPVREPIRTHPGLGRAA